MRIKAVSSACVGAGILLAFSTPPAALAQSTQTGGVTVAGEIGARVYTKKVDSLAIGKFQEYRDLRAGQTVSPVFEQVRVAFTPRDSMGQYSLTGRRLFDRDQSVNLLAKRPGDYDFRIDWDRILHTYSTTARSPGVENNPMGFNTLPNNPRPDSNAWRNAPYIGAVMQQWDPVKASLGLTPSEKLDFKTDYTRIGKSGGIPLSMSFAGSSGPQREFVAPIDQTMHDFTISQSYASGAPRAESFLKNWQVMASYGYSKFQNAITSALVDNPQTAVSTTSSAATSRVSLAPNNSAQMGSVVGAVLFPLRTRVTGAVNASWATQNDAFLPQTNNARPRERSELSARLDAPARKPQWTVAYDDRQLHGDQSSDRQADAGRTLQEL